MKLSRTDYDKWWSCYRKDLQQIVEDDSLGLKTGIPRNTAVRTALKDFYYKYHVGSATNCGMSTEEFEDLQKIDKFVSGCQWWQPCWIDPSKWVPQTDGKFHYKPSTDGSEVRKLSNKIESGNSVSS